jgi:hypothetical protein
VYTELRPDRKRLLGRPRPRWDDNIKLYLEEIGWNIVDWFRWFRTGTRECGDETICSINVRTISLLTEVLIAFQKGSYSIQSNPGLAKRFEGQCPNCLHMPNSGVPRNFFGGGGGGTPGMFWEGGFNKFS